MTQAEHAAILKFQVTDGLLMFYGWRRDFSNQPPFWSDVQGVWGKIRTPQHLVWFGRGGV